MSEWIAMHQYYDRNIPIDVLRSFVCILDTGSFTKAAALLKLTQPGISGQMKRLQYLVGDELFRKDCGIALTERGEAIGRYARRILSLNDRMLMLNRNENKIRVGIPSAIAAFLGKIKRDLDRKDCGAVQMICDRSDHLERQLSAGLLDAALVYNGATLKAARYEWHEPLVWIRHPQFVLRPGAPLPLISWSDAISDRLARRACEETDVSFTIEFEGDQLDTLFEAVSLKMGYLCVPERTTPKGMKIANDYFLPKLPTMHAGIYQNVDCSDQRLNLLCELLAKVMSPRTVAEPVTYTQRSTYRSKKAQS
jgi:DNA-binding transcriptional LysR family regulator